jgi:CDGSH-type Zn-finger protein/uncharacterized Fe-S cluster protein YjdI
MATEVSVRDREQLHYLLSEAAEIEHDLMCCYLYAAFSMKDARDDLQPDELEATQRWRRSIMSVAIEEMTHLSLVSNLLTSIGGTPHFGRQNFPTSPGAHPAGIVLQLAALDRATLDHFIFLERPEGVDLPDGAGFAPTLAYVRGPRRPGLMPMALDFATVGALYAAIRTGFTTLAEKLGERALFVGDPAAQVGPELLSLPGMRRVTDLASAHAALETIVQQGEGAPGHAEDSHFRKFLDIRNELDALVGARASFAPARPAARNPVMRRPPVPEGRVWITAPTAEGVVDLANSAYTFSLRLLAQGFGWAGEVDAKRTLLDAAIASMQAVGVLGSELTRMPASHDHPGVTAGMTFALLRTIAPLPHGGSEWTFPRERAKQLADACEAAAAVTPELSRCARLFEEVARELSRVELSPPAAPSRSLPVVKDAGVAVAAPAPAPSQHDGAVEIVEAEGVTLQFEARRCIHARHCVLGEPEVFVANVVGPWLHPERTRVEDLMRVATACPSGAITLVRKDGGPEEAPPKVNVLRVRENGPYAVHAELAIDGEAPRLRATLCRCGKSRKKPYCDGSHVDGFVASGEPATLDVTPLSDRRGPLRVRPLPNGPLDVQGNVEICAGTGRSVLKTTGAKLCRCGGSGQKPLCDGTHARIGFRSDT